jgi:hypothetical protein
MADILQFRKPTASEKAKGKTLCKRGFHKWVISKDKRFDSTLWCGEDHCALGCSDVVRVV